MKALFTFLSNLLVLSVISQSFDYYPTSNGELIKHTYYALSYLEEHEQPEWVAYHLKPEMLHKVYKRKNTFRPDPKVSKGSATYADYKSAPNYDAGHLLPSRQMQFDCTAMSETFFMSNMSPQESSFNRHKWSHLERLERNMAFRNGGLYVITGPVLKNTLGHIGVSNKISIPSHYYKIFLYDNEASSKAIAFLLPNKKESKEFIDYVVPIDSIESLTGIDFFPILEDELENKLESVTQVELWSFSNPYSNFNYTLPDRSCNSTAVTPNQTPKLIEVNSASSSLLESLPGIGPVKAQAIINSRPFSSKKDLLRVKGIGPATLNKIEHLISVK